jgi:hypothetical protein
VREARDTAALASGHRVSTQEALLRASNYYRTAADFLLEKPPMLSRPPICVADATSQERETPL